MREQNPISAGKKDEKADDLPEQILPYSRHSSKFILVSWQSIFFEGSCII
jgi:hypothetical protein